MKLIEKTYKKSGNIHHAYLIEGDKELIIPELLDVLERGLNIKIKANPDFLHKDFDKFGIDEARFIKEFQSRKTLSTNKHSKKIIIITTPVFTHEAQNALLKTLEDPSSDTHFFIILPDTETILPAFKSRVAFIYKKNIKVKNKSLAESFMKSLILDRLEFLKNIIEEKNKKNALELLNDIEIILYENNFSKNISTIKEIGNLRQYLRQRSSSIKMIMEHLCIIVPQIK